MVGIRLRIYDSSGLLVFSADAGRAPAALGGFNLSADPWDPGAGALTLSEGSWSFSYDGKDGSGAVLRNGAYLLVLESEGGGSVQKQLRILGAGAGRVSLLVGPNPVRGGQDSVRIAWSPIARVELKIYSLDGGLVRDFGPLSAPPQTWDLRSPEGRSIANGIYVVSARIPGERTPQTFKIMVAR